MTTPTPDDVARAEAFAEDAWLLTEYSPDEPTVVVGFGLDTTLLAAHFAEAREAGAKAERERIIAMLDMQSDAHFRAMADDEAYGDEKLADIQFALGRALCDLSSRIENSHPKAAP